MTGLKNHKGKWLDGPAARSFDRMEDERGRPFALSSAGRTEEEQNGIIRRWDAGGKFNRPPYLYNPARPAKTSSHVRNGGRAADITNDADRRWIKDNGRKHGWTFPYAYDIVHAEYNPALDQYAGGSAVGGFTQVTKDRQDWLISRGWKIKSDGVYGPATRQAYAEYQNELKKKGLYNGAIDGLWGKGTQAAHQSHFDSVMRENARPKGYEQVVKDRQDWLNSRGWKLNADGVFGPKTKQAIKEYQAILRDKRGYKGAIDGLWGPGTQAAHQLEFDAVQRGE